MKEKKQLTGTVSFSAFRKPGMPKKRFCPYCGHKLLPEVATDEISPLVCKWIGCPK